MPKSTKKAKVGPPSESRSRGSNPFECANLRNHFPKRLGDESEVDWIAAAGPIQGDLMSENDPLVYAQECLAEFGLGDRLQIPRCRVLRNVWEIAHELINMAPELKITNRFRIVD